MRVEVEREGFGHRPQKEFSVFVRNLPGDLDRFGLKGIFEKVGRVCDTFIPRRGPRWNYRRFGFVRFRLLRDAKACIQRYNGAWVRGCKIHVSMAKPRRIKQGRMLGTGDTSLQVWQVKRGKQSLDISRSDRFTHEEGMRLPCITGQKNEINKEWLRRTLVCTTKEPRNLATLSSAISNGLGPSVKVAALSSYKFLLTFLTLEELESTLANQGDIQQWFLEVKKWGSEEACDSRRVWLSIVGVPPHGWNWENFKKIADLWGDPICLNISSTSTESFEVMKVLIATKVMHRIDDEILLQLDYEGYRVTVRESETVSQAVQRSQLIMNGTNMEDTDSNYEIPGFEDLEDIEGMAGSNGSHSNQVGEGVGSPSMVAISNSNSNVAGDKVIKVDGQNEVMGSRTNTASFSQNGYSEELFKISQHLKMGTNGITHTQEDSEVQAPPGFEKATGNHDRESIEPFSKSQGQEDGLQGGGKNSTSKSQDTATQPPGFETTRVIQEKQLQQGHQQVRVSKSKKLAINVPQSSANTEETTASMIQLAEESLQVGELLGVRVIGNKKAAVTCITDHLKKRKAQGRISQKQHKL